MASSHITKVTVDGVSNRRIAHSLYGRCSTAAATVEKEVTIYTGNGRTNDGTWTSDDLFHGLTITVSMKYSNSASSPTLNVNGSEGKPIYRYGTTVAGTSAAASWLANATVDFTYDTLINSSGCWMMHSTWDNNTTYTNMSQALASAGTATTARSISAKVLHDTITLYLPSPVSSYHTTVGDGSLTTFTVAHYLNTKNILVSVNITDNNVTYIAPLTNLSSSGQIGYSAIINNNDSITISFTSAPPINGAEISIVSAIAFASASDQSYLRIG